MGLIKKVVNDVLPKGQAFLLKEQSCRFCYKCIDMDFIKGTVKWIKLKKYSGMFYERSIYEDFINVFFKYTSFINLARSSSS